MKTKNEFLNRIEECQKLECDMVIHVIDEDIKETKTGLGEVLSLSYEEKMKNPKLKNDITYRWRRLGLVQGIKPNSKTEKNVIEGFECMALYLLKLKNWSDFFELIIFPIIRLIYTGEKLTGKKLYSVVDTEKLFNMLNTVTFKDVIEMVNSHVPKSMTKYSEILLRLVEYKKFVNKPITQINKDDFVLTDDEKNLLTALFPNEHGTGFDFEAEITYFIPSYIVFKINEENRNNK
jgi:hypothetical protein